MFVFHARSSVLAVYGIFLLLFSCGGQQASNLATAKLSSVEQSPPSIQGGCGDLTRVACKRYKSKGHCLLRSDDACLSNSTMTLFLDCADFRQAVCKKKGCVWDSDREECIAKKL